MFVCLFVCNENSLFAQEEEPAAAGVEIYVFTKNITPESTPPYIFTLIPISVVFDKFYNITNIFPTSYYQPLQNQLNSSDWSGWDHVATSPNYDTLTPRFGFALYKFYCADLNFYFYLDWRDTRYQYLLPRTGQCADLWIWYDGNTHKFYYTNHFGHTAEIEISNGEYLSIWNLKGKGTPSTSGFENYETNCNTYLDVKPEYNSENYLVPFLTWGTVPNFSTTGYKIYRRVAPLEQQYSLIAQVDSSQFTYSDNYVSVGGNRTAYYKVKAYNGSSESAFSNEASIAVTYANPGKRGDIYSNGGTTSVTSFSVSQNYPNPFNPFTEIRYSLPEPSHVKIVVMNTLGQEVRTLVNAQQSEGVHSVAFHASGLPSGVYFYKVYAGDFTEIKKMTYLR